jgi:predicted nucleic acid-binding protein
MERVRARTGGGRLILDAGALIALAHGDRRARSFLDLALDERRFVQVPTPVLAQVHRGGRAHARTDRVLNEVDEFVPTTVAIARDAGELLGHTGLTDAVDAIVVAEALRAAPSVIITSDPADLTTLKEDAPVGRRVLVSGV